MIFKQATAMHQTKERHYQKKITLPIAFQTLLPLIRSWSCISNARCLGYPKPFFGEIDRSSIGIDHDISCMTFDISYMSVLIIVDRYIERELNGVICSLSTNSKGDLCVPCPWLEKRKKKG